MTFEVGQISNTMRRGYLGEVMRPEGRVTADYLLSDANPQNKATAANILGVLGGAQKFTEALRGRLANGSATAGRESLMADLEAWSTRLGRYIELAKKEADTFGPKSTGDVMDPTSMAWTVTAPLLLGIYGGNEQRTADITTPFILSNATDVTEAWEKERIKLFWRDVKSEAKKVGGKVRSGLGWGLVVAVVAFLWGRD